jgi:hypothetical protein
VNRAHLIAVAIHDPQGLNKLGGRAPARAGTESETPRSQEELLAMIEKARN